MRVATNGSNGPVRIPPIPECLPKPLRAQLRTIRDEVPPMSDTAFTQLVEILREQHDETKRQTEALKLAVSGIEGQVKVLMAAHIERADTKKQDVRKVRDVVLQIAVVLLLTGLLTVGVQYVKGTPPPQTPEAQGITAKQFDELLKEIRADREAREAEPVPQPTKKPNKPRRTPEPQRLNRLKDEVTATNPLPTLGSMRFPYETPPLR